MADLNRAPTAAVVSPRSHPDQFSVEERIIAAATEWMARKTGKSTPDGTSTPKGNWYPDDTTERRQCCRYHVPTATYPQAVRKHCLGLVHVAYLFDVPAVAVKRAARRTV